MQPGSFGDTDVLPRVARRPRARFKAPAKPRLAANEKESQRSNAKDVIKPDETNASDCSSAVPVDESPHCLSHFYVPRRRAVSPYRPSSESADLRLQKLVHHYTTVVATLTVTPVGPRHEWFPFAAVDEALFHAVMSHTAAHSAYLRKVPLQNETDYFWHTGQAIRLVNARLGEGIYKAATDGTICAVCCLTQQQAFNGQVTNTRMHLNGLIQLVHAAGGLQSITLSHKTRRFILLTDLATSITLQKKFYLEPTLKSPHLILYFGPASAVTSSHARTFGTRLFNFSDSSQLSHHAQNLFWGLRNLSLLLEDIRAGRASPDTAHASDLQFTDRVEILERLAHLLWYHESSAAPTTRLSSASNPPPMPAAATVFALLGYTTLIYIYTVLRELPAQLGMLKLVAGRIAFLLEHMPPGQQNVLLATFSDLMVWVMFLGGRVAAPREKVYLARQVSRILLVNKCESEESILEASQKFLWPEVCDEVEMGGAVDAAGLQENEGGEGDLLMGGMDGESSTLDDGSS